MYLLIPEPLRRQTSPLVNLHSIMYLLILRFMSCSLYNNKFTFHNVSINSYKDVSKKLKKIFTFHNVSINSKNESRAT